MHTPREPWIQTYSGRRVCPLDFQPEDFSIVDVAHALSHICRFSGHTRGFYSVAEHSFHVANEVENRMRGESPYLIAQASLQALLHDASEVYLGDLAAPLKHDPALAGFARADEELQSRIYLSVGLPAEMDSLIKQVDREILTIEAELLMGGTRGWSNVTAPARGFEPEIRGVPPMVMRDIFTKRYQARYQVWQKSKIVLA